MACEFLYGGNINSCNVTASMFLKLTYAVFVTNANKL